MLSIQDHRLVGDGVRFRATPNYGGKLEPRYLVFHYTAGRSCDSSVESLCTRKARDNASAHLVVASDGSVVQLAPFDIVTWHAGVSHWNGRAGLNKWSIGIEMDNAGRMDRVGRKFIAWFGKEYAASEVVLAEHKHGGGLRPWHAYAQVQIARALELAALLVSHYRLEDVLGHEDIARGRKQDPGPAFPLADIAGRALGRSKVIERERYVVTADTLNIRSGPAFSFDPVASPLMQGAVVLMLQPGHRWSKVAVENRAATEGWVNNSFIAQPPINASRALKTEHNTMQRRAQRRARG